MPGIGMPVVPLNSSWDGSEAHSRVIHIWEFPPEGFYVKLETRIIKGLVNCVTENMGARSLRHLACILEISADMLYGYCKGQYFIPLSLLLWLCDLAGGEFAIEQVEPHIVAYKSGGSSAKPIRNPNLPLVETPDLFAFMGHLMGDGGHDTFKASYSNSNEMLIQNFLRLLQEVFGEVPVRITTHKLPRKNCSQIWFGMTIVRLLRHLYHVDFGTFTAQVPRRLFELPREYAAAFLRAFGDDEGCVQDKTITLWSVNQELLRGIHDLIQVKFPELKKFVVFEEKTRIYDQAWRAFYSIRFRTGAFAGYRALIGFSHYEKQQDLDQILARRERGWRQRPPGETRRMLLMALCSAPMTAKVLAPRPGAHS